MIEYSAQVNNMCPITKGPKHGPAPIPEEGEWVKAYKIEDISGYTVTVPEGYYFVMGDNRNGSTDSRSKMVGFVKESEIVGRVVFRVFPFQTIGTLN